MPAATVMTSEREASQWELPKSKHNSVEPERQRLWLPSALPSTQRAHNCHKSLVNIKVKLWQVQCHDILDKIRNVQCGHLLFIRFWNRNIQGQNPNTRAKDTLDHLEDKMKSLAVKYRTARKACWSYWVQAAGRTAFASSRTVTSLPQMEWRSVLRIQMTLSSQMVENGRRNSALPKNWVWGKERRLSHGSGLVPRQSGMAVMRYYMKVDYRVLNLDMIADCSFGSGSNRIGESKGAEFMMDQGSPSIEGGNAEST